MQPFLMFLMITVLWPVEQPKLVKMKVTDTITVKVPKDWKPMDDLDLTERYPSVRKPIAAFTDVNRELDFAVKISATQWPDSDIDLAQKFFKASLMNMFDRVEVIDEGIHEIGKKKFIFFEFESRVNGNRKEEAQRNPILSYNYVQYLVEADRTLVFTFSCPRRLREDWQETARKMMQEIKVK